MGGHAILIKDGNCYDDASDADNNSTSDHPGQVEIWEASMTIGFIPVMIITSVMAEKGWLGFLGFCPPTQVTLTLTFTFFQYQTLILSHSPTLTLS